MRFKNLEVSKKSTHPQLVHFGPVVFGHFIYKWTFYVTVQVDFRTVDFWAKEFDS